MKTPRRIVLFAGVALSLALTRTAAAAVTVVNGDFENTSGLGGGLPWFSGVPAGWGGVGNNYTVGTDGSSTVANLEQVGPTFPAFTPLYQDAGVLDVTSSLSLTFTVLRPWNGNAIEIGTAIWGAAAFASDLGSIPSITAPGTYTLTVDDVPAGTPIRIGFWRVSGSPGLDNVSMTVTPVPEVSAMAFTGLGLTAWLGARRRRAVA